MIQMALFRRTAGADVRDGDKRVPRADNVLELGIVILREINGSPNTAAASTDDARTRLTPGAKVDSHIPLGL